LNKGREPFPHVPGTGKRENQPSRPRRGGESSRGYRSPRLGKGKKELVFLVAKKKEHQAGVFSIAEEKKKGGGKQWLKRDTEILPERSRKGLREKIREKEW